MSKILPQFWRFATPKGDFYIVPNGPYFTLRFREAALAHYLSPSDAAEQAADPEMDWPSGDAPRPPKELDKWSPFSLR